MLDGQFDDFLNFFDLLVETSNHIVGGIWYFFDFHEGDEGIDLGGENLMKDVVIGTDCDSQVGLDIFDFDRLIEVDDILSFVAELSLLIFTLTSTLFLPMTLTTSPT